VRDAVAPEYRQQLRAFLEKHEAHLLTLAGRN
jgi:glutathione S-transferase